MPATGTVTANTLDPRDIVPPRPRFPTQIDQDRTEHTEARWQVLNESWDDLLEDWLEQHVDEERLDVWGPPDTSANPLGDICRQLTTPGLYGVRPRVSHMDQVAAGLVGEGGFLDDAGAWTKLQRVQYFACGLGDYLLRVDADAVGRRLSLRLVSPHNTYATANPDHPDEPTELWELRLRWWAQLETWVWVWDQYRLEDPDRGGEPSYRATLGTATSAVGHGEDVSAVFLGTAENPEGIWVGDRYPWIDPQQGPQIPYAWYRSEDSGELWNVQSKRGAFRGTLNAALNWTYAQHAARDASGSMVLAVGVAKPATSVRRDDVRTKARPAQTLTLTPGAIVYHQPDAQGGQVLFQEVGPGSNLEAVAGYASLYEQKQAVRWGLNPADLQRLSNAPMSGAALFVTSKGRREFARQLTPLFRRADLRMIRLAALALSRARIASFPLDGYSIQYHQIPESPQEQAAAREELDWDLEHGVISPVEVVQQRRPGTSREDAVAQIVRSEVERRQVEALVAAELERLGLEGAPPPPPAPPAAPDPADQVDDDDGGDADDD